MANRSIAFLNNRTAPVGQSTEVDFEALAALLSEVALGRKDGPAWMPAEIAPGPRKAGRVREVSYLVLDVEAKAEAQKDDAGNAAIDKYGDVIKVVTGPEAPTVDDMAAELALHGWRAIVHTSYSHGTEHPRYRLVLDIDRPLQPSELKLLGTHVAGILGIPDCFDAQCLDPARLFYLPRVPSEARLKLFHHEVVEGSPLPVDALLTEAERIAQAQREAGRKQHQPASGSVIDAFNAQASIKTILESNGYQPKGRTRWIWAGSTTGLPGVRLLPGDGTGRVYSSHDGDPLADGHAHDSFSAWCILEHGGNLKEAVKEAARLMGMEHSKAGAECGSRQADGEEENGGDAITPPPVPDTDAMLYGIIGEIARAGSDGKEVHPVAVAAAAMSWLSAEVGPDIYLPIGDTRHHANLYTLHIGRSARGGKGESLGLAKRIRSAIGADDIASTVCGQMHTGGLSSREGLAGAVHDGFKAGKEVTPAIEDKRLWIVESEFANVLSQGKREGNTLLPALRDVWDGGSIQPLTKGKGVWSTRPHISLHGNVTPGELQARIEAREVAGGTFNRILMIWAERTCLVAFPEPTDQVMVDDFANRLQDILTWAVGRYPAARDSRRASMTPEAARLYNALYPSLRKPHAAGDLIAAATERRAPICLRIALLHAILEKSLMITPDHIKVGHAWAQYGADTAAYVLAGMGGQARDTTNEMKVIAFLESQPGKLADRTTITKQCFSNRIAGGALDKILVPLVDDGALIRRVAEPRAGGRTRVIYSLPSAKNAKNANYKEKQDDTWCEECAKNANFDHDNADGGAQEKQTSQSSRKVRTPQSPVNADSSHNSQNSHTSIREQGNLTGIFGHGGFAA